ncbi:recombinase family protein [Deltaproteobacteria bacterium TL4]
MKVYGYARLNDQRNHPKTMEIEAQSQIIHKYAEEHGYTVDEVFSDIDRSSATLDLPSLQKVFELAENGEIDILIIARLDRLTRTVRLYHRFIQKVCFEQSVRLISIEEGIDSSEESGRLALDVINIIAKWDSKMISDRTKELIERKREVGESVGHAPFGFTYKNKKLIPSPHELKTVSLIRFKRNGEVMSYHKIAKYLNEHKIPSKRGGRWYAETVKTIYQNPLYNDMELVEPQ